MIRDNRQQRIMEPMSQTDIEIPHRGGFLKKLWALTWPYFRSEEKWIARGLLAVIVTMSLGLVYLNVLFNYWYKDFYDALQNKDEPAFWHQIERFIHRYRWQRLTDRNANGTLQHHAFGNFPSLYR